MDAVTSQRVPQFHTQRSPNTQGAGSGFGGNTMIRSDLQARAAGFEPATFSSGGLSGPSAASATGCIEGDSGAVRSASGASEWGESPSLSPSFLPSHKAARSVAAARGGDA